MKKIIERKIFYQCSVCKTKYANKKEALKCELRTLEKKVFEIGNYVKNIEPRFCQMRQKYYFFSGKITKITDPELPDVEYETRWLMNKKERLNAHVFLYQVKFRCPHCKETREERYYAPELQFNEKSQR